MSVGARKGSKLFLSVFISQILYILSYNSNIELYVDDYLEGLYVNDNPIRFIGKHLCATYNINFDATFGDEIKIIIRNEWSNGGLYGIITINGYSFSTNNYSHLITTNITKKHEETMYKGNKETFKLIGTTQKGYFSYTFVPRYLDSLSPQSFLKTTDAFTFDVGKFYTFKPQSIAQGMEFQVNTLPTKGVLYLLDNTPIKANTKYSIQEVKYQPGADGGYMEEVQFVISNSKENLTTTVPTKFYICWKGCNCTKDSLCKDKDCKQIGKMNCTSCSTGYSFCVFDKENRKECWDKSKEYDYYFYGYNDQFHKCYEKCIKCTWTGNDNNHGCVKCMPGHHKLEYTDNCYPEGYFTEGYYLGDDDKYHKCHDNCKTCKGPWAWNEHNCTKCKDNYALNGVNCMESCYKTCETCSWIGNEGSHGCTKCISGYNIVESTSNCRNSSIIAEGYYLGKDQIYHKCPYQCKTCSQEPEYDKNNYHCESCNTGLTLDNGNCITKSCYQTCQTCSKIGDKNNHECFSCKPEYKFLSGTTNCENDSIIQKGYYLDRSDNKYHKCSSNCTLCSKGPVDDKNYCTECPEGYALKDGNCLPCYESCKTCYDPGTKENHFCQICKENLYFVFGTINCEEKSFVEKGYYFDVDNKFHQCSSNCTRCSQGQKGDNHNCLACKKNYELENGNCIYKKIEVIGDAKIENVDKPLKDLMKENITEMVDSKTIIKGDGFQMQVFEFDKDNTAEDIALKNKLSTIEMDECIKILRETLKLKDDEHIIIAKIDKNVTNSTVNQVEFILYAPDGTPIDFSICNNTDIIVNKPLVNPDLIDLDYTKEMSKQGIDVFDTSDGFFNDICYPYDSENKTDVVLRDRRRNYYKNISFCEGNCNYSAFDVDSQVAQCKCTPTSSNETMNNIENNKINLSSMENAFLSSIFTSNLIVAKCYNLLLRKEVLYNIGFWTIGAMVTVQTVMTVIYCYVGLENLRNHMKIFVDNPPVKRRKIEEDLASHWDFFDEPKNEQEHEINEIQFTGNQIYENVLTVESSVHHRYTSKQEMNLTFDNIRVHPLRNCKLSILNTDLNTDTNSVYEISPKNEDAISCKTPRRQRRESKKSVKSLKNSIFHGPSQIQKSLFVSSDSSAGSSVELRSVRSIRSSKRTNSIKSSGFICQRNTMITQEIKPSAFGNKRKRNYSRKNSFASINTGTSIIINSAVGFNHDTSSSNYEADSMNKGSISSIDEKIIKAFSIKKMKRTDSKIIEEEEKEVPSFLRKSYNLIPKHYEKMTFEEAIKKDTRPFWVIYWEFLIDKQIIIATFYARCFLDLRVIKIYIFFFSISLDFTINALFYTDDEISDIYYNNGVLNFLSSLPRTFYSCAIGFVIGFCLSHLSDSRKKLESLLNSKELKTKEDFEAQCVKVIKTMKTKFVFFFSISLVLSYVFWYYTSCFCGVYHNTQVPWLLNSLMSMAVTLLVPFITSFILVIFRYSSLRWKNRCLYRIYKFVDFFL